jgi:hypothetical protein
LAKGDDFGVGRRVGVGEVAVPAPADDLAAMDYDRTHGDFARFQCALRGAESLFHPEFVGGGRWSFVVGILWLILGHG